MKLKYLTLGLIAATVSIGCGANQHKGSDMYKIIISHRCSSVYLQ